MNKELERFSLAPAKNLVCSRCWTTFFSTLDFKELYRILEEERTICYTVASSEIEKSAASGCNWCRLILSHKEDAEELTLGSDHAPLTELQIEFGSIPSRIVEETFTPSGCNRFGLWINGASYYMTAFTSKDDPVSDCITARELDHRVNSSAAFHEIEKWLTECNGHEHCPPKRQHKLPSRVIEVFTEHDSRPPRLFATNGLTDYYTALSYCWGTSQTGITLKDNLKSRLQQLDMSSLSCTVQNAILVTRRLGIKYLWVDAICIVQDSEEDKVAELSKMCNIYQHATLTIVAASAKDSKQGFLGNRPPPSPSVKVPFWSRDGKLGSMSLRFEGWYGDETEPVNTRAWTLQERILSPKLLIYASHTLQYQCQHHIVNLGNSINIPSGFGSWRLPWSLADSRLTTLPEMEDIQFAGGAWTNIIAIYSQRRLSYVEDKLTALAGIAELFHSRFQIEYLGGLWSGALLPKLLLWEAAQTIEHSPCSTYTAPSWSWASLVSPVHYSELYSDHQHDWYNATNCTARMTLKSPLLPFGQVTSGHLEVSAYVRLGMFQPPQYILWDAPSETDMSSEVLHSSSTASLDSSLIKERRAICLATTRRTYEPKEDDTLSMSRLRISFPSATFQRGAILTAVDGLIICPAGSEHTYRRIGVFRGADDEEFKNCPRWTVTLI